MASWNQVLPDLGAPLLAKERNVRSDDWMAQLPTMISQTLHSPRFPVKNSLIHPNGHEMLLGMNVPVSSWIAIFKPTTWGYFVSPDFGLAWHWQFRIYLLLIAAFCFFSIVMKAQVNLALMAALCLVFSSFFAYWSYISEPITGLSLMIAVLVYRHLRWNEFNFLERLLLIWALVSFCVNNLYPPFQVPMVYFVISLSVFTIIKFPCSFKKLIQLGLCLFIAISIVSWHFYENFGSLEKILNTEYPGLRISTGGDLRVGHMFLMSLLPLSGYTSFSGLSISEAGSSYFLGLLGIWVWIFSRKSLNQEAQNWAFFLLVLSALLAVYSFIGIPSLLAQITGWSRVPGARTLGLWSLLNVCWLVWWVQNHKSIENQKMLIFFGFVGLSYLGISWIAVKEFDFLTVIKLAPGLVIIFSILIMMLKRPHWGIFVVLLTILGGTIWFNPVDRLSHHRIINAKATQNLIQTFKISGKKSVLLLDGDIRTANLLRMLGISSYGGMHFYPQNEFWKQLDPQNAYSKYYNRFAHVAFNRSSRGQKTYFENPSPDVLLVHLSEDDLKQFEKNTLIIDRFN